MITCSHFFTSGPANELEEYLKYRVKLLVSVFHPFYHSTLRNTVANFHLDGKVQRTIRIPTLPRFGAPSYFRDFIVTIFIALRFKNRYNFFIGSNPLNAFAGILLRRLGVVERVVFYKIDYVPERFENPVLNSLYHWIDQFCSRKCDWTWNLARTMVEARKQKGVKMGPQLIVPIGSHFERIERLPLDKIDRHRLVYMGSLRRGQGIELAIQALPLIRKLIPDAELLVVGSGPLAQDLKDLTSRLGLQNCVTFTGQIPDHKNVERMLCSCAIGLATYEPIKDGFTQYTEPGKVKVYLACGLPVIITRVPEIADEIQARAAGYVIDYDPAELAHAVQQLCGNDDTYESARIAAIDFASAYSWTQVFQTAFSDMLSRT